MSILGMKYFVLILIGIGVIDLIHDAYNLIPSRKKVSDIEQDALKRHFVI